jgi:hypothetical protein
MSVSAMLFEPRHMPCDDCGASLSRAERDEHVCVRDDWARYQAFQLRDELEEIEHELALYLATPAGRFAAWDARRRRLDGRP